MYIKIIKNYIHKSNFINVYHTLKKLVSIKIKLKLQ